VKVVKKPLGAAAHQHPNDRANEDFVETPMPFEDARLNSCKRRVRIPCLGAPKMLLQLSSDLARWPSVFKVLVSRGCFRSDCTRWHRGRSKSTAREPCPIEN